MVANRYMKNKNYGYIYKTTNRKNNRVYIGKKKGEFNSDYFGSGIHLNRAINKYGKSSFKLEVIIYTNNKYKLNKLEKFYIKEYRRLFGKVKLYNITSGGDGGDTFSGRHHTEEAKEKNRLAHLGKPNLFKHKINCKCFCCKSKRGETTGKHNSMFGKVGKLNPMFGKIGATFQTKWMYHKKLHKNKCVPIKEVKNYLKNNWILGRSNEVKQNMRKPKRKTYGGVPLVLQGKTS